MHQGGARVEQAAEGRVAWARDALATLARLSGVRRVGLALTEGGGRRLRFTASDRVTGPDAWCHVDAYDDVPLNTVVRTGAPVVGALTDLEGRYGDFVARQRGTATVALAAQPLVAAGQVLGGFVLFFDAAQPFDHAQRAQLAGLGAELAAGLRRAQRREQGSPVPLPREPVPPEAVVAHHDVDDDVACVAPARRFLRETLGEWGIDQAVSDTAVLCLSELVTNALIHTQGGCSVRVVLDRGVLTTTVRDRGTGEDASGAPFADPLAVSGRGLYLVDALATRWGSELDQVGTTVWFVLEV